MQGFVMRPSSFEVMWGVFLHKLLLRLTDMGCLTNRCLADMQCLADAQKCERLRVCCLKIECRSLVFLCLCFTEVKFVATPQVIRSPSPSSSPPSSKKARLMLKSESIKSFTSPRTPSSSQISQSSSMSQKSSAVLEADEELLQSIQDVPEWKPAVKKGQAKASIFSFPLTR